MLPRSAQNLIEALSRLPGIGPRAATRITLYLLNKNQIDLKYLSESVARLKDDIKTCKTCFNIADCDPCDICNNLSRDNTKICVVEDYVDIISLEKAGYDGLYHILGGVLSAIDGIGPNELNIKPLILRLVKSNPQQVKELIIATNPTTEGEITAVYITEAIANFKKTGKINSKLHVTKLAQGLPMGGDLEYADEVTLKKAMEGRREYN